MQRTSPFMRFNSNVQCTTRQEDLYYFLWNPFTSMRYTSVCQEKYYRCIYGASTCFWPHILQWQRITVQKKNADTKVGTQPKTKVLKYLLLLAVFKSILVSSVSNTESTWHNHILSLECLWLGSRIKESRNLQKIVTIQIFYVWQDQAFSLKKPQCNKNVSPCLGTLCKLLVLQLKDQPTQSRHDYCAVVVGAESQCSCKQSHLSLSV